MAVPTAQEQYMLELINRARANPSAEAARQGIDLNQGLASGTISTAAKAPLAWDPLLIDSARAHSQWMLDTDSFSHAGVGGSSPGDRMKAAGYVFSGSWSWGENIAIRWGAGTAINAQSVEAMESGLFKSAGHRTNLLSESFREIGIGLQTGEYKGSTGMTGTQNFAKTAGSPFVTGVAFDDKDGDDLYDPGEGLGGVLVKAVSQSGAIHQTTSYAAGGYQLELPAGSYSLSFSGGGLAGAVTKSVSIGTGNAKVDLNQDVGTPTPTPPPATSIGTQIVVNARGVPAAGVNAHFDLLVDGRKIGGAYAGTTAKDFAFTADVAPGQGHKVQVQYNNDAYINGQDRSLYVDKVTIGGKAVLPTDGIVTYDKGALDGRDVVKGQSGLWWNGTLVVNADKGFFPARGAAIASAGDAPDTLYEHLVGQSQMVAGPQGHAAEAGQAGLDTDGFWAGAFGHHGDLPHHADLPHQTDMTA